MISILSRWYFSYGWHLPPRGKLFVTCTSIVVSLAVWLTFGFFLGLDGWKRLAVDDFPSSHYKTTADK
jgi:hypothetical protein